MAVGALAIARTIWGPAKPQMEERGPQQPRPTYDPMPSKFAGLTECDLAPGEFARLTSRPDLLSFYYS